MTWKEALRVVNGLSLGDAMTLLLETADPVVVKVCECRRDDPAEYAGLLEDARIVPVEDLPLSDRLAAPGAVNLTSSVARALLEGWTTLEAVATRTGRSRKRVAEMVSLLPHRRALAVEKRRRPGMLFDEYRAVPAVPA